MKEQTSKALPTWRYALVALRRMDGRRSIPYGFTDDELAEAAQVAMQHLLERGHAIPDDTLPANRYALKQAIWFADRFLRKGRRERTNEAAMDRPAEERSTFDPEALLARYATLRPEMAKLARMILVDQMNCTELARALHVPIPVAARIRKQVASDLLFLAQ